MDLLVLGGTAWLGREIAAVAVARGHAVTCLARGQSGQFADGCRSVIGNRDNPDAYDAVTGQPWDAVIDVGRQPGHVRRAVTALQPMARRFLFVSSGNVYASQRELGQDEGAPLLAPLSSDVMASMEFYGEAKSACEEAVLNGFGPDRTLIARAGLIGGPGDEFGRSSYWPWRFAHPSNHDQEVLVPDGPDLPTSMIDVRDLALWIDDPDCYGFNARSTDRARAAGLTTRPLEDTLADTLAWEESRRDQGPHGAGLTDNEEKELLRILSAITR